MHSDDNTVLFDEGGVRVTPSWFVLGDTSHALRTVVTLRMAELIVPRGSWKTLFYVSLLLIVFSAFGLGREGMPPWIAYGLFAGSILLALTAARFAFVVRDAQRLEVVLVDGTVLRVDRPGRAYLTRLHAALTRAMDWHVGDMITK